MRRLLAAAVFVSILSPLSIAQAADKLYFYTENFPPYNMSATGRAFEHKGDKIDGLVKKITASSAPPLPINAPNSSNGSGH